jgi:hypothetical protein
MFQGRSATAARPPAAARKKSFSAYPALIPHPGTPGLGNVPGYYQAVLAGLVRGKVFAGSSRLSVLAELWLPGAVKTAVLLPARAARLGGRAGLL